MLVVLLVVGAGLLTIGVMLFRAFVLFPCAARRQGWKRAFCAYGFSIALAVILTVYEAGNLTGFSWARVRYVSDRELIDHAIAKAYPGIYGDLADLQVDYPDFAPEVRFWGTWHRGISDSIWERALGFASYEVKLPDAVVRLDTDGQARTSLACINHNCAITAPAHPAFGIIATVQRDAPDYALAPEFRAYWDNGASDDVTKSGHCVSAYSQANPPVAFVIDSPDAKPLAIQPRFGFYLVAARLAPQDSKDRAKGFYETRRITREQFLAWRSCAAADRADWPDFAGSWWKR